MSNIDMVNHPPHYKGIVIRGIEFEAIEIIEALVEHAGLNPKVSGNLFNALKYVTRLGKKDSVKQELGKSAWYMTRAANIYEENSLISEFVNKHNDEKSNK